MVTIRRIAALGVALLLSACGSYEAATMRNAPLDTPGLSAGEAVVERAYDVQAFTFAAPSDLRVSEGNGYYPFADVVWRGDPIGDRVEQIGAMFQTAVERNETELTGPVPVIVEVELVRFHGVTERTRFSVGGIYNIRFNMTVRHAETGAVIEPTRFIEANLPAPGGAAAILADQRGQTEKVRVTDFLTQVMEDELSGVIAL